MPFEDAILGGFWFGAAMVDPWPRNVLGIFCGDKNSIRAIEKLVMIGQSSPNWTLRSPLLCTWTRHDSYARPLAQTMNSCTLRIRCLGETTCYSAWSSFRSMSGDPIFLHRWSRWWFQIFFIFTPVWGRFPIWLIFFKWVETTNQWYILLCFMMSIVKKTLQKVGHL